MPNWDTHLAGDGAAIAAEQATALQHALDLQAQLAETQSRFDTYKLSHPDPTPSPDPTPEPAPTPIAKALLVGSSLYVPGGMSLQQGYDQRCAAWGVDDLDLTRIFFPQMAVGWPTYGSARTLLSFKPPSYDVKGFVAGKYDTAARNWLNALPRDKTPRQVCIFHEREDDIADGRFTFADARAMDDRMNDLVNEANARNGTNVRFGLVLMGWTLETGSRRDVNNYLPASGTFIYDWIGWDAYTGDSAGMDLPNLPRTEAVFGEAADVTKAHNSKAGIFICETGTANYGHTAAEYDTMQADWITGATNIARDLGFRGLIMWDSVDAVQADGSVKPSDDYRVKGPKARAAMGAAIKHS